jgi:hypothetical protein
MSGKQWIYIILTVAIVAQAIFIWSQILNCLQ